MKKTLFRVSFFPIAIIVAILLVPSWIVYGLNKFIGFIWENCIFHYLHKYENWCLDYEKQGYRYLGDGIYTTNKKDHQ